MIVPVHIRRVDGIQIASSNLRLEIDPGVLEITRVTPSILTNGYEWTYNVLNIDEERNQIKIIAKRPEPERSLPNIYDQGSLFFAHFNVLGQNGAKSSL